jgi:murein DD-endopeptidase MepM/ murein hydrolase activator NlpD
MDMEPRRASDGHRTLASGRRRLRPRPWLGCAVLFLVVALLAGCSGSSSDDGSVAGVTVQRTVTPTTRPVASATKRPASPTAPPATSTAVPATETVEPTAEPTAEATPLPTVEPPTATAESSPLPPSDVGVTLSPPEIPQGGAAVVQVASASAAAAVADFAGRRYPLLASEDVFWGVLGVPASQAPGAYPVLVTLVAADGRTLRQLEAGLTVTAAGFPVEYVQLDPSVAALLDPAIVLEEIDHRAAIYSAFTPERLWSGPFLMPAQGPIGGVYGAGRSYNGGPVTDYHKGTDIVAEEGAPVVASNTGRVAFAGSLSVRGGSVILDHGAGVFSAYHHLSALAVVEGQLVTKGDLVGAVGHTGLAEGPHLHWEIVVRGVEVDALLWTQAEYGPVPPG